MLTAIDRSFEAFERIHGVKVTIHDLDGSLAGAMDIKRTRHRHPICAEIKNSPRGAACYHYEYTALRPQLDTLPGGRIQRCHAGLVEWVMPIRDDQKTLRAVLFVGPRRWEGSTVTLHDEQKEPTNALAQLPVTHAEEAAYLLEVTAQLAARVAQHLQSLPHGGVHDSKDRQSSLEWLLYHHVNDAINLGDVARMWGVGKSRASHIVRELTGTSWRELVTQQRLKIASHLLRSSDLSVQEIAGRTGFVDRVAFGRAFKRRFATTPGKWRRARDS